jgi:hypothetical protein
LHAPAEHQSIEESIKEEDLDGHIGHQQADYNPKEDYEFNWLDAMETDSVGGEYSDNENMPLLVSNNIGKEPPPRAPTPDQDRNSSGTDPIHETEYPVIRGATGNLSLEDQINLDPHPRITQNYHLQSSYLCI